MTDPSDLSRLQDLAEIIGKAYGRTVGVTPGDQEPADILAALHDLESSVAEARASISALRDAATLEEALDAASGIEIALNGAEYDVGAMSEEVGKVDEAWDAYVSVFINEQGALDEAGSVLADSPEVMAHLYEKRQIGALTGLLHATDPRRWRQIIERALDEEVYDLALELLSSPLRLKSEESEAVERESWRRAVEGLIRTDPVTFCCGWLRSRMSGCPSDAWLTAKDLEALLGELLDRGHLDDAAAVLGKSWINRQLPVTDEHHLHVARAAARHGEWSWLNSQMLATRRYLRMAYTAEDWANFFEAVAKAGGRLHLKAFLAEWPRPEGAWVREEALAEVLAWTELARAERTALITDLTPMVRGAEEEDRPAGPDQILGNEKSPCR